MDISPGKLQDGKITKLNPNPDQFDHLKYYEFLLTYLKPGNRYY